MSVFLKKKLLSPYSWFAQNIQTHCELQFHMLLILKEAKLLLIATVILKMHEEWDVNGICVYRVWHVSRACMFLLIEVWLWSFNESAN